MEKERKESEIRKILDALEAAGFNVTGVARDFGNGVYKVEIAIGSGA
jgi:hypothetical protein